MSELSGFSAVSIADKGREVKDPSKARILTNAPTFTTNTIPDVDKKTRIIAVCGATDRPEDIDIEDFDAPEGTPTRTQKTGAADPIADGWFFSDFYAFKLLLEGHGASQTWITSEPPEKLVARYKTYLHGNPYYDRKVVLDARIVKEGVANNLSVVPRNGLLNLFRQRLRDEAKAAREGGQTLLVMVFGHRDWKTKGMVVGDRLDDRLFHMKELKNAVGEGIRTTLVTTACYSGGWVVNRDLNMTAMTAAGPLDESESWNSSPSVGRYCGSIYASALFAEWRLESERAEKDTKNTKDVTPDDRQKTFAAFTENVYDTVQNMNKFAWQNDIRFGAQDDDWLSAWGERTGIPLVDFKSKWDKLEIYPASADHTSSLNRDTSTATTDEKSLNRTDGNVASSGSLRSRFTNSSSLASHVEHVARMYLDSKPGRDSLASNTTLHGQLRMLRDGKMKRNFKSLETIYKKLEYRTGLMVIATQMLLTVNIRLPEGLRCDEIDMEAFESKHSPQSQDLASRKYYVARGNIFTNVLPDPNEKDQGARWSKPHRYLAAALALDPKINNPKALDDAIKLLEQVHTANVAAIKKDLDNEEEIRGRKRTWLHDIGKKLRSLSPENHCGHDSRAGMG